MNWKEERNGDNHRSRSPSLRRSILEQPRFQDNPYYHSHSHRFSGSALDKLRNRQDENSVKLYQFSEKLHETESPSKKFQWETLFAKNPANANSKSSLGLERGNGFDNDNHNQRHEFSTSQVVPKSSSSSDVLEHHNFPTFYRRGVSDCSCFSPSRKFDFDKEIEISRQSSSAARVAVSDGNFQDEYDRAWRKQMLNEEFDETELGMTELLDYRQSGGNQSELSRLSQQIASIPQDDCYQDSTRTSIIMDSVVEGYEDSESVRNHYGFYKEPFIIEDSCMTDFPFWMERDRTGKEYVRYETNCGFLVSKNLERDEDLCEMEDCRNQNSRTKDKRKGFINSRSRMNYPRSESSQKRNVFSRICRFSHVDEQSTTMLTSLRRPLSRPRHPSPHLKSKRRDLTKRLGISLKDLRSNLSVGEYEKNKRDPSINQGNCSEEKTKPSISEPQPPEDSKELNQLIKSAFFKFVKVLCENPIRQKKFIEPGSGTLKCVVCGSNSKEFKDTLSLSHHAFGSLKGSRAEHLGLHKALCWLMGWSSEAVPNSLWVQRILPDEESLALKEDLIIWPPVLIVHNSSITNNSTSERVTVSCEELEVAIRATGLGEKIKVERGKPANQSIMVVIFGAVFSGLQEAERLHRHYADKNHGKDQFQKLRTSHLISHMDDLHKVGENKMENVIYGYLGLAEDMDKLDFETKKRSMVKSKRDIQAIVDASLISVN